MSIRCRYLGWPAATAAITLIGLAAVAVVMWPHMAGAATPDPPSIFAVAVTVNDRYYGADCADVGEDGIRYQPSDFLVGNRATGNKVSMPAMTGGKGKLCYAFALRSDLDPVGGLTMIQPAADWDFDSQRFAFLPAATNYSAKAMDISIGKGDAARDVTYHIYESKMVENPIGVLDREWMLK